MRNVLQDRISGDRGRNVLVHEAIERYRLDLEMWTQESMLQEFVDIRMNMGNTLLDRICENRGKNINEAIEWYKLDAHALTLLESLQL